MDSEKIKLSYYTPEGELKSIDIGLRFLTPAVRVKFMQAEQKIQSELDALKKKPEYKTALEESVKAQSYIKSKMDEYKSYHPDETTEEYKKQEDIYAIEVAMEMNAETIDASQRFGGESTVLADKASVELFKVIYNPYSTAPEVNELVKSPADSDFWQNVNIDDVTNAVNSFRGKYLNRR